ncbi:hypothetical protein H2201_003299 [Coniosporium apollinis]|uniref:Mannan endo-1,6-alpha-mannosidase n=2 Tax=Coniosporium TaxID=2810619 RepID=A0ABQ9NZ85_9PEZI|nr:hypothetical protein H2199_008652 [Cladosporium sp. JES 115]KAJ9666640.1 hypothetical protein H2201_003299 [Coniosporium apollinis]
MKSPFPSIALAATAFLSFSQLSHAIALDLDDSASIRAVAKTYAHGLLQMYPGNQSGIPASEVGIFPKPHYWWEAGAVWGGVIDYWAYTGDDSFVETVQQALYAQMGPGRDFMNEAKRGETGNDDQAFWALAAMAAAESRFPRRDTAESAAPTWLSMVINAFNTQAARWDLTSCAGGLKWQIFPENAYGYNYKNAISNGGFFQMAARLLHYTGDEEYLDWAERTWDWCTRIGLISPRYYIFDGSDDKLNCSEINHLQFSYNAGMFLGGAAYMYNYTNGSTIWAERVAGLLEGSAVFFSPYKNATDIMYEAACETVGTCNLDQQSFKAYLSRWLAKTSVLVPFTAPAIRTLLRTSAAAAARSCSGGADGVTCGSKWYTGAWDGTSGVGQQLSAMEVTQALLIEDAPAPVHEPDVYIGPAPPMATVGVPKRTVTAEAAGVTNGAAVGSKVGKVVPGAAAAVVLGFGGWL